MQEIGGVYVGDGPKLMGGGIEAMTYYTSCLYITPPDSDTCGCTASVFKDIKKRIRRMRGEDK